MRNKKIVFIIISSIILISLGTFATYSLVEYILAQREKPTLPDGDYSEKKQSTNNDFDQTAHDLIKEYDALFEGFEDKGLTACMRRAVSLGFKKDRQENMYTKGYNPPRFLNFIYYYKTVDQHLVELEIKFDQYDLSTSCNITAEKNSLYTDSKINNNSEQPKSTETNAVKGQYPQTSIYKMNASEFYGLSKWELKIMRNEIFARHGYIFKTEDMKNYFTQQSWYVPRYSNVDSDLTEIEKYNIEMIKRFE